MKVKILFIIDSLRFGGGAERVVSTLSHALAGDYEIHVITFIHFQEKYPIKGKYYSLNENKDGNSLFNTLIKSNVLIKSYKIKRYIQEIAPDIIISFMEYANIFSLITKLIFRLNIPLVTTIHCNPLIQYKYTSKYLNFLMKLLYPLKINNKIVTVSNKLKEIIQKCYKINESKIEVIYNPVDIKMIDILKKKDVSKYYLANKQDGVINFINVSTFRIGKGHGSLIKAFSKVKEILPKAKLILVGDGPTKNEIETIIKNRGLEKDIMLFGLQRNPFKFMYNSDLFIFPSLHEGFGLILLEALVCEIPIISYNCKAGPEEILKKGKYGKLVNIGKIKELSQSMIDLAHDKELREQYSSISRERAKDFDVKIIKNKWINLIENEIKRNSQ